MSWLAVEKALIKSLTSQDLGYPIVQENETVQAIKKAENSDFWLEFINLPATTDPLDKNTTDQYNGIVQININGRLNLGKGAILGILDQLLKTYQTGSVFIEDECRVEIDSISPEPSGAQGSFFVMPVSIVWFAFIAR